MSADEQLSLGIDPAADPPEALENGGPGPAPVAAAAPPPEPTGEQRDAIDSRDRDVFCEAGAGSGKTRVLVGRYCDSIECDGIELQRILAFTFTERAAAELRGRIRNELSQRSLGAAGAGEEGRAADLRELSRASESAWVTTIHGFCRRLLATHPIAAGADPGFRVLDAPESERLLNRAATSSVEALVRAGEESVARTAARYRTWMLAQMVLDAYRLLRGRGMSEPQLPEAAPVVRSPDPRKDDEEPLNPGEVAAAKETHDAVNLILAELGKQYGALKAGRSALDFSDLELGAVELLRSTPELAARWSQRFDHLLVDEFQDTNRVQLELIGLLQGPETRLFTVGDEQQSIYRFRGAELEVFRAERAKAEDDAGVEVLPLRGNFRSRPGVLAASNTLGRTLLPGFAELAVGGDRRDGDEPSAELLLTLNEGNAKDARKWSAEDIDLEPPPSCTQPAVVAEARFLAERLRTIVDDGEAKPGEIVVLLRAFTHVDAYEEALARFGLEPYVVGGRGYWSQQQVEDLLRLLACVANPLDDEMLLGALAGPLGVSPDALWLLRAATGPKRHIWPTIAHLYGEAESAPDELDSETAAQIPAADAERMRAFCTRLADLRTRAALTPLAELIEATMEAFDYDVSLLALSNGAGRMANVRKLMRLAFEYERGEGRDLHGFLAHAAQATERDEREGMAPVNPEDHDGVRIMTVHGAKGLEFPYVAVPGLNSKLIGGYQKPRLALADGPGGSTRLGLSVWFPARGSISAWELNEIYEENREAEAEEGCRLLYVAATRAQRRLILSGAFKPSDLEESESTASDTAISRLLPALGELGWDGEPGELELPSPAFATGGGPPSTPLRIGMSFPSPERAAELRRRHPSPERAEPRLTSTKVPLLSEMPRPAPIGHLSYSALASYQRCGYRFYLERVLGVRESEPAAPDQAIAPGDEITDGAEGDDPVTREGEARGRTATPALALGNAVHAALEWSARRAWERPGRELIAGFLAHGGLPGDAAALERACDMVGGWFDGPVLAGLKGRRVRAEAPFALSLGGTVLRGNIDLLASGPGEVPVVVDYKSDALGAESAATVGERYASQRAIYALAVAAALDVPQVRTAHVFLERPGEPVIEDFDAERLESERRELERAIDAARSGSFEVAADPYPAMCFRCPAAARLCPHPAWRPRTRAPVAS